MSSKVVVSLLACIFVAGIVKAELSLPSGLQKTEILKILGNVLARQTKVQLSRSCFAEMLSPAFKQKAMYYIDAIGKPASGYLQGNFFWRGAYDECKDVPDSHYCLTDVQLSLGNESGMALEGICAPSACNEDDILFLFDMVTKALNISKMIYIPKDKGLAPTYGKNMVCPGKVTYTAGAKGTLAFIGVILFLCLVGTVAEIVKDALSPRESTMKSNGFMPVRLPKEAEESSSDGEDIKDEQLALQGKPLIKQKKRAGNILVDILLSFSLIKNIKMVMNTDVPKGALTSLNGIRVLSMWWVILGHLESQWANIHVPLTDNMSTAYKIIQRFTFMPIDNGFFSVDSFFLLSGLLVSYLSMRRFDTHGRLPMLQFYLHRFLRLTPVYMFVILFFTYILPLMGDGPLWSLYINGGGVQACKDYWWTNLLYINNFYPVDMSKSCIGWTWYLANDMQFYVISPIFLYAMFKFKLPGALVSVGLMLAGSFIVTGVLMGYYHLTPFLVSEIAPNAMTKMNEFMKYVYVKPYCRIMPYLVGMVAGYILHKDMRLRGKLKWVYALLGWALAMAFGMMLTYGTYPYYKGDGVVPSEGVNVAYGAFSRFVWGAAVAWVVYACHFQLGGYIDSVLSWRGFIPLSRLTYGVYMIHLMVLGLFCFSRTLPFHFTDLHIAIYFMATVCASYGGAFILAVCIEMPCFNLEKLAFKF